MVEANTLATKKRLETTYFKQLEQSGLTPYLVGSFSGDEKPVPFKFCFSFTDYGNVEANLGVKYFKASLSALYPDCMWCEIPFRCDQEQFIPVRAQAYAKMRRSIRGNLIFLDPDIIAYKRVDPFEADFEVGLTDSFKTWPLMPFNGGVRFFRDTPGAQLYMDTVMEMSCNTPDGLQGWWTDQLAMRLAYETLKDKVNIKIFPHRYFNFVPEGVQATDAYFVHLKGDRKQFMRQYLATVLETDHFEVA